MNRREKSKSEPFSTKLHWSPSDPLTDHPANGKESAYVADDLLVMLAE